MYVHLIDDEAGVTLVPVSTKVKPLRDPNPAGGNVKAAVALGEAIAKQAIGVGINCVCFDRNRYRYHGRVKALAEAARKAGLVF